MRLDGKYLDAAAILSTVMIKPAGDTHPAGPLFSVCVFKALNITFLPLKCYHASYDVKIPRSAEHSREDFTWPLFMLPFKALIARCFGTIKAPSPVVIITAALKRSAVSDWHSKWPFCQRRDRDSLSPGRHTCEALTV